MIVGRRYLNLITTLISIALVFMTLGTLQAVDNYIEIISVSSESVFGNYYDIDYINPRSTNRISADGRYVVFASPSDYLVSDDTDSLDDVFVHDFQTGETTRVDVSSAGIAGNQGGFLPAISSDGRFVAFQSDSTNLVPNDTNGSPDIFVHDRQTHQTTRVNVSSSGGQASPSDDVRSLTISADGRFIAFESGSNNLVPGVSGSQIYMRDRQTNKTSLVSISNGIQGNGVSENVSMSGDGRYLAFRSDAHNLVPGVTFGSQIYVHDQQTGQNSVVSVSSSGTLASGSYAPAISADGRFVTFNSPSSLVAGVSGHQIYVHDRQTGLTTLASISSTGVPGNQIGSSNFTTISADGRFVVFESEADNLVPTDTNNRSDIFVHDRQTGNTDLVSISNIGVVGNESSYWPAISPNGRFVVFESDADNLLPKMINFPGNIFVRDLQSGYTKVASMSQTVVAGGRDKNAPAISADGRFIVFASNAENLIAGNQSFCPRVNPTPFCSNIYLRDRLTGSTSMVSVASDGTQGNGDSTNPGISADGSTIAFISEATNLTSDNPITLGEIYIHNVQTGETTNIPYYHGSDFSPALSANGQIIAFSGVYIYNQQTGQDTFLAAGENPAISADGNIIVFQSGAEDLVLNDTNNRNDIFLYNRITGQISRVSVSRFGEQANGNSYLPAISANGRFVSFASRATNLVPNDTNAAGDVFVHDLYNGLTTRVSVSTIGTQGNSESGGDGVVDEKSNSISADGRFVTFASVATNLVAGDTNSWKDIFVHDMHTGITIRVSVSSAGIQASSDLLSSYWPGFESMEPTISSDGKFIVFKSGPNNLIPDFESNYNQIYLSRNPLSVSPPDMAPFRNYYTTLPVVLTWNPISWATGYEVQVNSSSNFGTVPDFSYDISANELLLTIDTLADGVYYWRIRAKNANGGAGTWSAVESFEIRTS